VSEALLFKLKNNNFFMAGSLRFNNPALYIKTHGRSAEATLKEKKRGKRRIT